MTTKYYVDGSGNYIGGFSEGNPSIPAGAVEVANPPEDASETWSGSSWNNQSVLIKTLGEERYNKETGGMLYNALPIATDDRSKVLVNGAYNKAIDEAAPTTQKTFKTGAGFQTVTNQDIIDLAKAMADHVQKCFDAEKATYDKIIAGTITTKSAVAADFLNEYNNA
jgi:hypothetical protein